MCCHFFFFFFFKQKTAYELRISDWSSDVCSSDLIWTLVVAALCVLAALSWWWAVGSQSRVDPGFTQAFVDLNKRLDDHATAVAYDPQSKIGRASCRERVCQYV